MRRRTYLKCEPKYIVKKEEGIVVCVLRCNVDLHYHPCFDIMPFGEHRKKFPNVTCAGDFVVNSVAKCAKEDTFDEVKGKRIAESRAKVKAFNIASKVYHFYVQYAEKYTKILTENMGNCLIVMEEEIKHLNELMK